jgi:cytochrome P450
MQHLCTKELFCSVKVNNPLMWLLWSTLCLNVPNVQESLMAGTDASTTTIEWALVELLKHPKVMKKVQDELDGVVGDGRFVNENDIPQLKYLQAIVKETFRLHPLAPLLVPHESIESCEINGYHVPAKTCIFVNIWAIHRSLCAYDNPLDFNPERFVGSEVDLKGSDFQLLPFGSGRRMCPALSLGLITVQMELAMLLHSFMWKLPIGEKPEDIDMGEVFGISTPKAIPLKVIATARLPLDLYVIP